ncbi:MAG TPA: hypothetical protein VGD67_22090 [Pseudonocardiaceae bacterium]
MRRRVALLAGTAGLVMLGTATPAAADSTQCSVAASGTVACAAGAEFVSYGEHLYVNDRAADGHSALVRYWLADGTGPHTARNSNGNGTTLDVNLELAEGSWIFYQVCVSEGATILAGTCSAGVTDYA